MILSNIKTNKKDRGFTIVELLVVIVVIGILAAITLVSYAGITNRANGAKAQANVSSIQGVAEAIYADNGRYPGTIAEFNSMTSVARIPSSIILGTAAVTSALGTTNFTWTWCGTIITAAVGGKITYWDYTLPTPGPAILSLGTTTGTCTLAS